MNRDNQFLALGLEPDVVEALASQNITMPTSIQMSVVPRVLRGDSIVVRSQTGSGKSLSYLLPIMQRALRERGIRVLIILPTRELVQQVARVARSISDSVEVAMVYGGVEYAPQREALARAPQIIVSTPGRLQDLLSQEGVEVEAVSHFILDEVDQMVDMGFRDSIVSLARLRRDGAQVLCFTATLSTEVEAILAEVVGSVERVDQQEEQLTTERIAQSAYLVEQHMMEHLLLHLLRTKSPSRGVIFCRSRKMADRLAEVIRGSGISVEAIHSDRSQAAREHILGRFRSGETRLLVATDLVARGIDVDSVSHIFNFGLPLSADQYIHRIGRTGRAGASGEAISLLCPDEREMLGSICAMMRQNVAIEMSHPYMTPAVTLQPKQRSGRKRGRKS